MKQYTVLLKKIVLLCVAILLASSAHTHVIAQEHGKPVSTGEVVSMGGLYSVRAPTGNDWMVKTDGERRAIIFYKCRGEGRYTFVSISPEYTDPSTTDQTEDEIAVSIFDDVERVMIEWSKTRSWIPIGFSRNIVVIGQKRLHMMQYKISDVRILMETHYAIYLYFPPHTKQTRIYYAFLAGDIFMNRGYGFSPDLTVAEEVINSFEFSSDNDLMTKVKTFFDNKQYDEAIEYITKALDTVGLNESNRAFAYYNRGLAYRNKQQYERAIEDYSKAIELDPKDAKFYNNRGVAYMYTQQFDRAFEDFNRAIELAPKDAMSYMNRGLAYGRKQQYDRAIEDYDKAIELDPKLVMSYNNRGNAYMGKQQYDRAIEDYNRAIELEPKSAELYNCRGNVFYAKQQHNRAIEDYNKAIELEPKYALAYYNRGNVYICKQQYDRAIEDFSRAIELNPKDGLAYIYRGITYYSKQKYDKAIEDYDRALELNPNYDKLYYNKACAHSLANRTDEACKALRQSIENGFNDWGHIKSDRDFDNIRESACYKEIMAGK